MDDDEWPAIVLPDLLTATAGQDGTLIVWHKWTGGKLFQIDTGAGAIAQLAVLGTTTLATVSRDGTVRTWDIAAALPPTVPAPESTRLLAFDPSGRLLAVGVDLSPRLYTPTSVVPVVTNAQFIAAGFTPAGDVITVDFRGEISRGAGPQRRTVRGGASAHHLAALSGDGRRVIVVFEDARVRDTTTFEEVAEIPVVKPDGCALSHDGAFATVAVNGKVELWRVDTPKRIATLEANSANGLRPRFSPDGTRLIMATEDGALLLVNGRTGMQIATLRGHATHMITALAFDPASTRVASADADGAVHLWDARTGTKIASLVGHVEEVHAIAFDPAGARIVTASADDTARLWVAATGAPMAILHHGQPVLAVAFSPDGERLATATDGLRLWPVGREVRSPDEIRTRLER